MLFKSVRKVLKCVHKFGKPANEMINDSRNLERT